MAPIRVVEWLRQNYPKPTVDPEWLDACLKWVAEELHLSDINSQADAIISNVDSQLLNSDLHDSMLAGTGLPGGINTEENICLKGNILVQIQGITDIGHSAFNLQNVLQTRLDRADLAGLAVEGEGEGGGEGEDEGPIPKYPRGMLRFDLSDGSNSLRAIEYRRMPELELGTTPLGYKMILKDVPIRQGIAFLEPSNVILKGHMTEELDVNREADFARGLRMRLGQPEPEPESIDVPPADPLRPPPQPEGVAIQIPPNANVPPRIPLREVTKDDLIQRRPPRHPTREELEPPTRRRVPMTSASTMVSESSTVASPYFSNTMTTSSSLPTFSDLTSTRMLPLRRVPLPSSTLNQEPSRVEGSFDFSDDMPIDDAFLQELEATEQAAIDMIQQQDRESSSNTREPAVTDQSQVIVIDSDEDDKENVAPVSQRMVRRRMATPDESDVVVIE